jgi:hypothetical protein
MNRVLSSISALMTVSALLLGACGDDDEEEGNNEPARPEDTGAACESADQCYPDVADGALSSEALCLDRVRDGYCTHECGGDEDCCAAEGECAPGAPTQVCSPFESTNMMMCFLSCEASDLENFPDYADENEFCQREASRDFICRASGGGDPHKICVPGDCGVGADCGADADCAADLVCVTAFGGGYCSQTGCAVNADCPAGSYCVNHDNGESYCYSECASESDCSFCRADGVFASCSDQVVFAEEGPTSGTVCVPPAP